MTAVSNIRITLTCGDSVTPDEFLDRGLDTSNAVRVSWECLGYTYMRELKLGGYAIAIGNEHIGTIEHDDDGDIAYCLDSYGACRIKQPSDIQIPKNRRFLPLYIRTRMYKERYSVSFIGYRGSEGLQMIYDLSNYELLAIENIIV